MASFEEPPEPEVVTPEDLEALRAAVQRRMRSLAHMSPKSKPKARTKAEYLKALLAGTALAPHGSRNNALTVTCGILAFAAPETPRSVFLELLRPSVEAMQSEGSSVQWDDVERLMLSAMRNQHQALAVRAADEADAHAFFASLGL